MKVTKIAKGLLAMTFGVAIALTAVSKTSIDSYATELSTDLSGTEEEVETALQEDSTAIENYQSKKLKVKPKKTTFIAGEKSVVVAEIGYEASTSDDGLQYRVADIIQTSNKPCHYSYSFSTSDPHKLVVSFEPSSYVEKLVFLLEPVVPDGIKCEQTKVTVTVKPSIRKIDLQAKEVLYKENGKELSYQIQATTSGYNDVKPYKPGALNWSLSVFDADANDYVPYNGQGIRIINGKLRIEKSVSLEKEMLLRVTANAADYKGNPVSSYVDIKVTNQQITDAIPKLGGYQDGGTIYDVHLNSQCIRMLRPDANIAGPLTAADYYPAQYFTYKSSHKDVVIDAYGDITLKNNVKGKVVFTITPPDKKKSYTFSLNVEPSYVDPANTVLDVYYPIYKPFDTADTTYGFVSLEPGEERLEYQGIKDGLLRFSLRATSGINAPVPVTVSGGINLSGKEKKIKDELPQYQYTILPTAPVVKITVKYKSGTKTYLLENTAYERQKPVFKSGEKKPTTSYTLNTNTQKGKIYVGKQFAGATAIVYPDQKTKYSSNDYYQSYEILDQYISGYLVVDEEGCIDTWHYGNYVETQLKYFETVAKQKGFTFKNTLKFRIEILGKDGVRYEPYLYTVRLAHLPKKQLYKLKTSYKVTKQVAKSFDHCYAWGNYDAEKQGYYKTNTVSGTCYYYQPIEHIGSKNGIVTINATSVQTDLSKDLLNGSSLVQYLKIGNNSGESSYLYVDDLAAYYLLRDANQALFAKYGKDADIAKLGKDGKVEGYLYINHSVRYSNGEWERKTDKVKVSVVIPKADWNKLKVQFFYLN